MKKFFTLVLGMMMAVCAYLSLLQLRILMCYVIVPKSVSGISSPVVKAQKVDAPRYNMAGQQVSKSYKGVVIQNGRKYLQK